ncbi:MAG: hypothetical protein COX39_02045 [Candidatus Nealsonbacteria bacterium CG23_combo_of_CG06-09_8_20_14_all_40_13]|uniref:Bacterial spore germination immunoglobulin-like domain-containing protein n=1 Tax=Candidatus Nealsonbacteria bacterium CG23_combo_of_CG06-09_8_20_14_all_40_13 TaxID=1974724 RepID=A0A2G9YR15_9BACT|nr:MAG: hypothetical protein COX39_02045 [Candidatus Nealsonbacteria bacterium CG23_combo_of_CG06-09_8_20_14_all_40_13]PIR70855.1 MAG: hypothetical protein COU44_02825 [Candidatus Nealsonbacteria bacterium CG10_big_fil_rev_8_21_14_0_10_40_24]PIU43420.1 MAG: hypothetical protein COS97_01085 [Candidatus Nealsonbacteria bacterium CG07_land_8_20_14_0_80_40_10]
MNKFLLVLVIILSIIVVGGGGYILGRYHEQKKSNDSAYKTTTSSETAKDQSSTDSTATVKKNTGTDSSQVATDSSGNAAGATEQNIQLTSIQDGDLVKSPALVGGKARVFENTLIAVLKDANGTVLKQQTITTNATEPSQFGDFTEQLVFTTPQTDTGTLELYEESPATGAPTNKITIGVKFK